MGSGTSSGERRRAEAVADSDSNGGERDGTVAVCDSGRDSEQQYVLASQRLHTFCADALKRNVKRSQGMILMLSLTTGVCSAHARRWTVGRRGDGVPCSGRRELLERGSPAPH